MRPSLASILVALACFGWAGHVSAAGPAYGLSSLAANRPISVGYLNALRSATGGSTTYTQSQLVTEMTGVNWGGFDVVVQAFAEPNSDGTIGEGLGNFAAYQAPLLSAAHARGKAVLFSIGGAYPPNLADQFAAIAGSPSLLQTFSQNVVNYLQAKGYDGVDIDWEFPDLPSGGKAKMTALMQAVHAAVKAANSNYIVMFATGPGYYMGSYDFAALAPQTDFYFYFGYDWKNPQNGPMTNPGSTQYTNANDQLPEASIRGGLEYVLNQGFPAAKIICGLPFYGSADDSWSSVRDTWAANQAGYLAAIDANSMEVQINGEWFTSPDCLKKKMDAVLKTSTSVLTNHAVVRGVGAWEIGHEYRLQPDLSVAFATYLGIVPTSAKAYREAAQGGTQARVAFTVLPNVTYHVQYTGSLTSPASWTTLSTVSTADASGQFQIIDPPSLPAQRFYRAIYP